jgi:hypothetical protein
MLTAIDRLLKLRKFRNNIAQIEGQYAYTIEDDWLPPQYGQGCGCVTTHLARRLGLLESVRVIAHGPKEPYRVYLQGGTVWERRPGWTSLEAGWFVLNILYHTRHYYTGGASITLCTPANGSMWVVLESEVT